MFSSYLLEIAVSMEFIWLQARMARSKPPPPKGSLQASFRQHPFWNKLSWVGCHTATIHRTFLFYDCYPAYKKQFWTRTLFGFVLGSWPQLSALSYFFRYTGKRRFVMIPVYKLLSSAFRARSFFSKVNPLKSSFTSYAHSTFARCINSSFLLEHYYMINMKHRGLWLDDNYL